MNELEKSVDFWVDELTHDTNPEHFNHNENFIPYMHDEKIGSFGNWMWNNGYNVGLFNLQTKVNTYCVPQWISVNDRLPEIGKSVLIYYPKWDGDEIQVAKLEDDGMMFDICGEFNIGTGVVTHWMPLPKPPKENGDGY